MATAPSIDIPQSCTELGVTPADCDPTNEHSEEVINWKFIGEESKQPDESNGRQNAAFRPHQQRDGNEYNHQHVIESTQPKELKIPDTMVIDNGLGSDGIIIFVVGILIIAGLLSGIICFIFGSSVGGSVGFKFGKKSHAKNYDKSRTDD